MKGTVFQAHINVTSRAIIIGVAMLSLLLLRLNPTTSFLSATIRHSRISGYHHHHHHYHRLFDQNHHPFSSRSTTLAQSNNNDNNNNNLDNIATTKTTTTPPSSSLYAGNNNNTTNIDSLVSHAEYLWENRDKCLTQSYHIPTIIIPVGEIHDTLKTLKDHLASALFEGCHPPIKLVRRYDYDNKNTTHKLVLLHPSSPLVTKNKNNNQTTTTTTTTLNNKYPPGPPILITIPPSSLPPSSILQNLLPPQALPPPSSFEQIGSLVHFNLKERHDPFRKLIGKVFYESLKHAGVKAVINKRGEVGGEYRTYDFELLAPDDDDKDDKDNDNEDHHPSSKNHSRSTTTFDVTVNEHGIALQFDLRRVYWNSRLAGDRQRLLSEFEPNDLIADAFCGVGALLLHAAKMKNCRIVANDLNPHAVSYCRRNGVRNLPKRIVNDRKRWSVCVGDGRDFIRELGMVTMMQASQKRVQAQKRGLLGDGDGDGVIGEGVELPRHLVMNYPSGSTEFLDALRWWPAYTTPNNNKKGKTNKTTATTTTVHVYTFARGDSTNPPTSTCPPNTNNDDDNTNNNSNMRRSAEEVAVDMVAEGLLPQGGFLTKTIRRREFLNKLGCRVRTREVRDVAPGKVVVCVSFEATGKLIRHMQGDFVDV